MNSPNANVGLRRRRPSEMATEEGLFPAAPAAALNNNIEAAAVQEQIPLEQNNFPSVEVVTTRVTRWYWRLTAFGALLALIITPNLKPFEELYESAQQQSRPELALPRLLSKEIKTEPPTSDFPPWLRWINHRPPPPPPVKDEFAGWGLDDIAIRTELGLRTKLKLARDWKRVLRSIIDPLLLSPSAYFSTLTTGLIDKILSSRLRLLWTVNLFLGATYCFHQAVAEFCLGTNRHRLPREKRLGGFLAAKFFLITCILKTDTLDYIILLSWYTCLSVLRSWSTLSAGTTLQAAHTGADTKTGAWQLLVGVFLSNCFLIAVNIGLFHSVGWSAICLLIADSVLLAIDVICQLMAHFGQVMEQRHEEAAWRGDYESDPSYDIDQVEALHDRRVYTIKSTTFVLQMIGHLIAVIHYFHIWMVHGLSFRFTDGVILMNLNSSVTTLVQKVSEHRRTRKLAQDLDGRLPDATKLDLQKASANSDVCCICLNGFGCVGNVKKLPCGHLFHVGCLQQVLHRAQSMQVASCPLCRTNLWGDSQRSSPADNTPVAPLPAPDQQDALFRFSTDGLIPNWLPIPGFSFEVVRRPVVDQPGHAEDLHVDGHNDEANIADRDGLDREARHVLEERENPGDEGEAAAPNDPPMTSPFRRLLILLGIIQMSPEEEEAAMEQLIDMFPQYSNNREELLRALRERGSAEAVAELALHGGIVPSSP